MPRILQLTGPILVGPQEQRDQAWVRGEQLSFTPPRGTKMDIEQLAGWVLPGLVDAHCHIGLGSAGVVDADQARSQAEQDRDAGALLIRDAGSPADTRWMDHREELPRLIRAGRHIARTRRYIPHYAHEVEPDQLLAYVAQEARAGDGWVKIVADWIDRSVGELTPCWPREALAAAVVTAHEQGARITAHCFGEEALPDLLAAGFDGIEHACGLSPATIDAAAAAQVAIVPTLVNIATFPQIIERGRGKFPRWAAQLTELHRRRYATVAAAAAAGVPIFAGTDAGGSLPHGLIAAEIAELARAGLSNTAAIAAATWSARAWLGKPGLIEEGPADCVVYPADPRLDLSVLAHPTAIILRGRTYLPQR